MLRSEATAKMAVRPRLSELEVRIAGATIVPDPSIVLCVHVRNVRLTLPVYFRVVLGYGPGILISSRG